jgi:aspartate 4-decarboxylase
MEHPAGLGGMPQARGIADRLSVWLRLASHAETPGASFLAEMVPFAVETFGFEPDAFVHELVDSIIGDNYPVPDRMLVHNERITHEYLMWAMCGEPRPAGKFDLYAVEGGTAAMCYLFKSLKANRLLQPGDTIALGTPIFTPYIEMTHLEDYALNVVNIAAPQENRFQFTDAELKKLEDPKIKAFFVVNPGNPTGVALSKETIGKIAKLVKTKRPDLMILTDDVYGTFVPEFRSLLGELPYNTIGVYSYSKYFGCTGWRLGVISLHEDNIYDKMIAKLPDADLKALDKRYGALTLEPRKVKFIDRIVADSRDVALNHTAGLSLPQQVMMTLFSIAELMDEKKKYQAEVMAIVQRRAWALIEGLGVELKPNPLFSYYYGIVDFEFWIKKYVGPEVMEFIKKHYHPLDIVFRLAEDHSIVLLNGGGFSAPNWSARVSFANLDDEVYGYIGRALRSVARAYVEAYRFATDGGAGSAPTPPARGGTKTGKTIKRTDAPYEKTLHA